MKLKRGKLAAYESQVSLKEPVVIKKQSSSTYNTTRSSPKLLDAPAFDSSVAKLIIIKNHSSILLQQLGSHLKHQVHHHIHRVQLPQICLK